jgi:hypothetical protein
MRQFLRFCSWMREREMSKPSGLTTGTTMSFARSISEVMRGSVPSLASTSKANSSVRSTVGHSREWCMPVLRNTGLPDSTWTSRLISTP